MANFIPKIVYGTTTIQLSHPAAGDPFKEALTGVAEVAVSGNGTKQTNLKYKVEERKVTLAFLTKAEVDALRLFFNSCAAVGNRFNYYPSYDVPSEFFTYYWKPGFQFQPKRVIGNGAGDFIYDLEIQMERPY